MVAVALSLWGVTLVEKLLVLLSLLPMFCRVVLVLALLLLVVNSLFLASLRASDENTGSVARAASCVTNTTTS